MENASFSGERGFDAVFGAPQEKALGNEAELSADRQIENENLTTENREVNVSLPPMMIVEDSEQDVLDVVKNNIPEVAKDGEGVEKEWAKLVEDCKKEVAKDPKLGQDQFTLYKTAFLRARYENRRDYLEGKIDLESIGGAARNKMINGLFGAEANNDAGKTA